ncbi:DDE_3 domain-containing protein [Trichonephila clavipes]|nr:DDE_3 domain-containing protein [Trichonephila clavipes]
MLYLDEDFSSKQSTAVLQRLTLTPDVQSGTDESKCARQSDSGRVREIGDPYHTSYFIKIDIFGGKWSLVCGGIMLGRRTPLYVFDSGTFNSRWYRNEFLETSEVFLGAIGPDYIIMDDNARPHRTQMVYEFHEGSDIHRMD